MLSHYGVNSLTIVPINITAYHNEYRLHVMIFLLSLSAPCSIQSPVHTTIGCGKQGFPSAQLYLSYEPSKNILELSTARRFIDKTAAKSPSEFR